MPTPDLRTDPRLIRKVLAHYDQHGIYRAARQFDLFPSTVYRWRDRREAEGPNWPTDADVAAWDAKANKREQNRRRWRRTAHRQHFKTGPALVDSTGTCRRLRALVAFGHSQQQIGKALGITGARISQLCRGEHPAVFRETADRVRKLYDTWSMKEPTHHGATSARRYAEKQGWALPFQWDDETIDDPATKPHKLREAKYSLGPDEAAIMRRINGDQTVELRPGEATEVVRRMTAAGHGPREIETITGINASRVLREQRRRDKKLAASSDSSTSEEAA